jgi:hypothetical protein
MILNFKPYSEITIADVLEFIKIDQDKPHTGFVKTGGECIKIAGEQWHYTPVINFNALYKCVENVERMGSCDFVVKFSEHAFKADNVEDSIWMIWHIYKDSLTMQTHRRDKMGEHCVQEDRGTLIEDEWKEYLDAIGCYEFLRNNRYMGGQLE